MDRLKRSEEGSRQGVGAMGRVKCSRKRRGRKGGRRRRELQEEDKDNSVGFDPLVDLPLDIAQLIFDRMNFTARFRVPAVCRAWRELSANRLTRPPTAEQPWMLLTGVCCPTVRLVDLSMPTPSAHHRHFPPAVFGDHMNGCSQTDIVAGCHDQFLILSQIVPHFNCIYDPFSGKSRALPSRTRDGEFELTIHRAKLSCAPTRGNVEAGRCLVAAMTYYEDDERVFLCRPDSDYWTQILSPTKGGIRDMAFHRGRLYAIDRNGMILVSTDLSDTRIKRSRTFLQVSLCIRSQVVLHQITCQDIHLPEEYLVESCGELLLVQLHLSGWCKPGKVTLNVYKVVEEEVGSEERKLVPINDLGDEMLFVGKCCSRSWSGSASGFFLKNCIYFLWFAEAVGRVHLRGDDGNALLLPKVLEIPWEDGQSYRHALWITPPSHPITQI